MVENRDVNTVHILRRHFSTERNTRDQHNMTAVAKLTNTERTAYLIPVIIRLLHRDFD